MNAKSQVLEQAPDENDTASLSAHLRSATRSDHTAVDAGFGHFGLTSRAGYSDFLLAHARILPLAERLLDPASLIEGWTGRTDALFDDLRALSCAVPPELDFKLPAGEAARWGAFYVVEGSRLGGAMLARSIPGDFPASYLSAKHVPGGWRELLSILDDAETGLEWRQQAVVGAKAMFGAYLEATQVSP